MLLQASSDSHHFDFLGSLVEPITPLATELDKPAAPDVPGSGEKATCQGTSVWLLKSR